MSDQELFESILAELAVLRGRLDVLHDAVLIGGQVIAVEQLLAGQSAVYRIETDTGQRLDRPYSLEPDLLVDPPELEETARWDELPVTLRDSGFARTERSFRWAKAIEGGTMLLDLFVPAGRGDVATAMTPLEDGDLVIRRARAVALPVRDKTLRIKLPHPADFLRMKLDNLNRGDAARPGPAKDKDALDIYAYVALKGPEVIAEALRDPRDARTAKGLREAFGTDHAPGVRRVLAMAPGLSRLDTELLAKAVCRTIVAAVGVARTRTRGR